MDYKDGVIETYINVFCDTYNQFAKRESLLKIWKEEFGYLSKEEYLLNFVKACRAILNDTTWRKMPSPGDVKDRIREMISGKKTDRLGRKPHVRPEFMKLVKESRKILEAKQITSDINKRQGLMLNYWDVVQKMCDMSGEPFKL
jgi:hypothetical protein